MGTDTEKVVIEIELDKLNKFLLDFRKAEGAIDDLHDKSDRRGQTTNNFISNTLSHAFANILTGAIRTATDAVVEFGKKAVEVTGEAIEAAEEFETSVVQVHNVAGDTASLEELHQLSLNLGEDIGLVGISALDASSGLETLYKGGLDTAAILGTNGLEGALAGVVRENGAFKASSDLSAISTLEFDESASLAITTLGTFGGEISNADEQAQFVTDTFDYLTKTANVSNTSIEDLSSGFLKAAPTLAEYGYTAEETIDYLALMADGSIKGATAGTQLRRMVANLNRDTVKVNESQAQLGTSLFTTEGKLRSLEDVVGSYTSVIEETGETTVFVSDMTAEQTKILGNAETQYADATAELLEYGYGLTDLSPEKLEEVTAEQQRALSVMEDLNGIGGEYVTITKDMTDEQIAHLIQLNAGVHGQNSLAIAIGTVKDTRIDDAFAVGDVALAQDLLEQSTDGMISKFDELHGKQEDAVGLEEQIDSLLETSAGKREVITSMLETLEITYGDMFIGALKQTLDVLIPLMDEHLPAFNAVLDEGGDKLSALAEEYLPDVVDYLANDMIPSLLDFVEYLIEDGIPGVIEFGESFIQFVEDVKPFVDFAVAFTEFLARTILLPLTETSDAVLWLADLFGITLPESVEGTEGALTTLTGYLDSANKTMEDGLMTTIINYSTELLDLVFDIDSVTLALDAQEDSSTYLTEQIDLNLERWDFLKSVWESHIIPLMIQLEEIYRKNYDVYVLVWTIVGDLITIFSDWFLEATGLGEFFDTFVEDTLTLLIESLGTTAEKTETNIDIFDDMKESLERIIDYIKGNWKNGMDNIVRGLSPVKQALSDLSGFLDGLLEKLAGVASWTGSASGRLPNDATTNHVPDSSTSVTNNYYNNNSQANTVNATTMATPQQLTSVFSTMSYRSI